MLSLSIAFLGRPHSPLGFKCWISYFFGCSQFREPTCVNMIFNLDSGLQWLCVLDVFTSEILHVWTTFSTWIQVLNFVFFWMLSTPIAYMCEPHSQLGFRCSILCFFGCFHFWEPIWVGHILNLDSGVEFCVFLDALNYENLHVRTTFSTWIQVLNGYVFWMLSIRRAYMCEPHSQLGFRRWILCFFGCFHFWEPIWVGHILNLDSGVEFCVFLDALTSESQIFNFHSYDECLWFGWRIRLGKIAPILLHGASCIVYGRRCTIDGLGPKTCW